MAKRYNSFREIGKFFGARAPKAKKEWAKTCSYCGGEMHKVKGTNVFVCGNPFIVDEELDGKPVQVFGKNCPHTEIVSE